MKTTKLIPSIFLALTAATQVYAAPYYTNKAGNMIWDKETGLVWARCQLGQKWDGNTCAGEANEYAYYEIGNAIKKFNLGGHTDWIVPTIYQLYTLLVCSNGFESTRDLEDIQENASNECADGSIRPTINTIAFPNTPASSVISSSPYSSRANGRWGGVSLERRWGLHFDIGYANNNFNNQKKYGVRLVRRKHISDDEAALIFPKELKDNPKQEK